MEIAYACKFVYRPDHCQVSRGHFYPELYVNFMNDVKEWFQLHLDMIVAKENEAVVLSWGICINKILHQICIILLEYPEKNLVFVIDFMFVM